jgi:uncharacterized protein YigE (DUF2233 family)
MAHGLNRAAVMSTNRTRTLAVSMLFVATAAFAADWQPVGPGVDYREFAEEGQDIHVTRVDLTNDRIRVVATRPAEQGMKVSDYAKKNKALAAINADYFDEHFKPVGLTVGPCGQWANTKDTSREGVVAVGGNRAAIYRQSEVMDPPASWVETAVSGWPALVVDCEPLTAAQLPGSDVFTRAPHPRTAVGLTGDRKTLYFVVADGRRTGVPGLTLAQLATFFKTRLRACSAINLDGGGSTAMWVNDKIVNRPSDGVERRVGDHLAVVLRSDYTGCDTSTTQTATTATSPATSTSTPATAATGTATTTTSTTTVAGTTTTSTPAASSSPMPTAPMPSTQPPPATLPAYPGPVTNPPRPR